MAELSIRQHQARVIAELTAQRSQHPRHSAEWNRIDKLVTKAEDLLNDLYDHEKDMAVSVS